MFLLSYKCVDLFFLQIKATYNIIYNRNTVVVIDAMYIDVHQLRLLTNIVFGVCDQLSCFNSWGLELVSVIIYWQAYLESLSRQADPSIREFLQLVRTRLSDLKATSSSDSTQEAEEQLKKWMEEYKITRNIPQGMIKASVFLSPFFVGHVLPLLLSPSESEQELRNLLIQDLLK